MENIIPVEFNLQLYCRVFGFHVKNKSTSVIVVVLNTLLGFPLCRGLFLSQPQRVHWLCEEIRDKVLRAHSRANVFLHFLILPVSSQYITDQLLLGFLFGEGQSDAEKGVKSNWYPLTIWTSYLWSVLACKILWHKRIISLQIISPAQIWDYFVRSAIALDIFDVWLIANPIEIFMKLIEEIAKELLRILMVIASKLCIFTRYDFKHFNGLQCSPVSRVVIFHKLPIRAN